MGAGAFDTSDRWSLDRHGGVIRRRGGVRLPNREAFEEVQAAFPANPEWTWSYRGKDYGTATQSLDSFFAMDDADRADVTFEVGFYSVTLTNTFAEVRGHASAPGAPPLQEVIQIMNQIARTLEGRGKPIGWHRSRRKQAVVDGRRAPQVRSDRRATTFAWLGFAGGTLGGLASGFIAGFLAA